MFNSTLQPAQYAPEKKESASNHSLCYSDIPDKIFINAVDAIISRMTPDYLKLMSRAKSKPEIISDYKSSLLNYYNDRSLTPERREIVREAQGIASNCNVITKKLPFERRISIFSEKNREFDENQGLDNARVYIKLRIDMKDIKEADSLDLLLLQLSKKILSLGHGDKGTFDIRLEKGCLSLEGNPWKWHFDGEVFKTSITVCHSNKKNWSTRIADFKMESNGSPANHGFLYDALKVYHRAPVPSDLDGEELNANDYRLFIRYNEFYTNGNSAIADRDTAIKREQKIPSHIYVKDKELLSKVQSSTTSAIQASNLLGFQHLSVDLQQIPSFKIPELEHFLNEEEIFTIPSVSDSWRPQETNQLVPKYSESLTTPLTLDLIPILQPEIKKRSGCTVM